MVLVTIQQATGGHSVFGCSKTQTKETKSHIIAGFEQYSKCVRLLPGWSLREDLHTMADYLITLSDWELEQIRSRQPKETPGITSTDATHRYRPFGRKYVEDEFCFACACDWENCRDEEHKYLD